MYRWLAMVTMLIMWFLWESDGAHQHQSPQSCDHLLSKHQEGGKGRCFLPAIVSWPLPALGRCHWLGGFVDTSPGGVDIVAKAPQYRAEQAAILHAIAASTISSLDDLVEEVLRVERDGVVGRVVEFEVLEGHGSHLVPLQSRQEC